MALGDLIDPPVFDTDEVYIRKFKEGTTRVRFLPSTGKKVKGQGPHANLVEVYGTEAWPSELEHYNKDILGGYFPCVAPHGLPCGGCADSNDRVRKRGRSWYANALDEDATVRVFRMGVKLKDLFQAREARHPSGPAGQPLSKRDYLVHHIGTGLESTYDPEADPDGLYDVDFSRVQPHNITLILENVAERARRFYAGDDEPADTGYPDSPPQTATPERAPAVQARSKRIVPGGSADDPVRQPVQPSTPEQVEAGLDELASENGLVDWPSPEQVSEADNAALRKWLGAHQLDYPPRANRSLLTKLVNGSVEARAD